MTQVRESSYTADVIKYKTRDLLRTLNSWKKIKTKTYEIGENRVLTYNKKKEVIIICDKKTGKEAVFTPAPWVSFCLYMHEVDDQLNSLSQDWDVAYCAHYDGGWHVSVNVAAAPTRGYSYRKVIDHVPMSVDLDHILKLCIGDHRHGLSQCRAKLQYEPNASLLSQTEVVVFSEIWHEIECIQRVSRPRPKRLAAYCIALVLK